MNDEPHHLFHQCALAAYLDEWRETGQHPPELAAVRGRANRYYEAELANLASLPVNNPVQSTAASPSRPRAASVRTERSARPCPIQLHQIVADS